MVNVNASCLKWRGVFFFCQHLQCWSERIVPQVNRSCFFWGKKRFFCQNISEKRLLRVGFPGAHRSSGEEEFFFLEKKLKLKQHFFLSTFTVVNIIWFFEWDSLERIVPQVKRSFFSGKKKHKLKQCFFFCENLQSLFLRWRGVFFLRKIQRFGKYNYALFLRWIGIFFLRKKKVFLLKYDFFFWKKNSVLVNIIMYCSSGE